MFDSEQRALLASHPASLRDLAYGPDPRQCLDLYLPSKKLSGTPVVIFVHGGGFRRGDKGDDGRWENANIGAWAAREGMLGIVINYRLAPAAPWPAGAEDVASAIAWARTNAAAHGGDPDRIVIIGTSAGAAHVAGYIHRYPDARDLQGAVLLSGLYGVTPFDDERDLSYFGQDTAAHATMNPLSAMTQTSLPLLIACAEYDPPRFQSEFAELIERRLSQHGQFGNAYIASGHNHYSLPYHIGTSDRRVADEIIAFIADLGDGQ
jgi:triacylglycerol lipase